MRVDLSQTNPLVRRRRRRGRRWADQREKSKTLTCLKMTGIFGLTFATTYGFLSSLREILFKLEELQSGSKGNVLTIAGLDKGEDSDKFNTEAYYGIDYGPPCPRESWPIKREQNVGDAIKCDKPRDATTPAHPAPRKMTDSSNPVYFLHIGKAGGTSVDDLFKKLLKCESKIYIGENHYDWSYVQRHMKRRQQNLPDDKNGGNIGEFADVVTFLRHPVSRASSQFHFSKTLPWAKKQNATFLHQTFDEYLDDPNKTWTQPIADGESGADFLAGIFSTEEGSWVASDGRETPHKQYLRRNKTAASLFAAERLENTTWFGIMEDMERSMKLLQVTLGRKDTPVLPRTNNGKGSSMPSIETMRKIEKYIPKDLWLYEYAKRLFEARWNYFMGNCTYVSPELPPLPEFG